MKLTITFVKPSPDVLKTAMEAMIDVGYANWSMVYHTVDYVETLSIELPDVCLKMWRDDLHDYEINFASTFTCQEILD